MYIQSIQLEHVKSFLKTEKVPLSKQFNIIVGPNNSGKTVFAKACRLQYPGGKHLSIHSVPSVGDAIVGDALINVSLQLSKRDFDRFATWYTESMWIKHNSQVDLAESLRYGEVFLKKWETDNLPTLLLKLGYNADNSYVAFDPENNMVADTSIILKRGSENNWKSERLSKSGEGGSDYQIERRILSILQKNIYFFDAERLKIGSSNINQDDSGNLRSNASNLPSVLLRMLTRNQPRFERYVCLVRQVFPDIHGISLPVQNQSAEIKLWSTPLIQEREDLTFSLSESGTGVGQILAMLYVVATSHYPKIIIIDEPQSFLHPGAIRKLFNILKQHDHQYIITTHSPIVISAANPDTLLLVRKEDYQSHIEVIDQQQKTQMNRVLRSVGANLSDVFGADNVLWVEGETEQECFPLILQNLTETSLRGTVIRSVVSTGDFISKKKKNVDLVFEIYERLTNNVALIPPAFGFIFDTEELSESKLDDLKRRSKDSNEIERIAFLPRMMYENFLIHERAIAFVLNNSQYIDVGIASEEIKEWIDQNLWLVIDSDEIKWNSNYFGRRKPSPTFTLDNALETLHGAKLLTSLFNEITHNSLVYDKVIHGIELTEWIVNNDPEHLKPIVEFLKQQIHSWRPVEVAQ